MGNVCSESRQAVQKSSASAIFRNTYKNVAFENISGDICAQEVDAIINAANNQLAHNNGLANSILLKGGNIIQDESDKFMAKSDGILDVGTAVITSAGNLPSKYVIHIVSPIWNGGDNGEEEKLANAVINALAKADEYKVTTLAVPCLSAGGFGFPTGKCATVMVKSFVEYLDNTPDTHLTLVRFVNMNNSTAKAFKAELEKLLGRNISLPNSKASVKASVRSQRQVEQDFAEHGLQRYPEQQKLENENRGSNQGNNDTFDNQEPERLPVPTSYSEGPEGGISYPGRSPIERGQDPQE